MIDYGLENKVALITGTNNPQGIGAATALAFAREKAKVVLVYKKVSRSFDENKTGRNGADRYYAANAGSADHVESMLKEINAEYIILERDISKEDQVKEIYQKALERFGRVDILVNNAAVDDENGLDTIEKITQDVIDDTFAVNVRGSLMMIREMINHRRDYGRIINISTDASQVFAGQITYGASKATMEALTRSIALEVAQYGITVNCVAPGPTQTGWFVSTKRTPGDYRHFMPIGDPIVYNCRCSVSAGPAQAAVLPHPDYNNPGSVSQKICTSTL